MGKPTRSRPVTAEQHRQQLADDYSRYQAAQPIKSTTGSLIYDVGHPVPASNVDAAGRVALSRHTCSGHPRCDLLNEVDHWSEPGAVVEVENGAVAEPVGEQAS